MNINSMWTICGLCWSLRYMEQISLWPLVFLALISSKLTKDVNEIWQKCIQFCKYEYYLTKYMSHQFRAELFNLLAHGMQL